jgi:hypothetical protein
MDRMEREIMSGRSAKPQAMWHFFGPFRQAMRHMEHVRFVPALKGGSGVRILLNCLAGRIRDSAVARLSTGWTPL